MEIKFITVCRNRAEQATISLTRWIEFMLHQAIAHDFDKALRHGAEFVEDILPTSVPTSVPEPASSGRERPYPDWNNDLPGQFYLPSGHEFRRGTDGRVAGFFWKDGQPLSILTDFTVPPPSDCTIETDGRGRLWWFHEASKRIWPK